MTDVEVLAALTTPADIAESLPRAVARAYVEHMAGGDHEIDWSQAGTYEAALIIAGRTAADMRLITRCGVEFGFPFPLRIDPRAVRLHMRAVCRIANGGEGRN